MKGYEVFYTGGGIWLSCYHMKIGNNTLTYVIDNQFPNVLSCFANIDEDYGMYEEDMIFSVNIDDDTSGIRKEIHKKLLKNLKKEMF